MFEFEKYTVADLVYWTGMIGGIIIAYFILEPMAVHPLLRLGAGIALGAGLGFIFEKLYQSVKTPKREHFDDEFQNRF